jgi:hypothetical protein
MTILQNVLAQLGLAGTAPLSPSTQRLDIWADLPITAEGAGASRPYRARRS